MLLSFSVTAMRPWIVNGLIQRGNPPGYVDKGERVKRQTIRADGPRAQRLLEVARLNGWKHPGRLDLWWKSRTKERQSLGCVTGFELYPVLISHHDIVAVDSPGVGFLKWSPAAGGADLVKFALADGFDSVEAFRDFFVPQHGDRFVGVVFKW